MNSRFQKKKKIFYSNVTETNLGKVVGQAILALDQGGTLKNSA